MRITWTGKLKIMFREPTQDGFKFVSMNMENQLESDMETRGGTGYVGLVV